MRQLLRAWAAAALIPAFSLPAIAADEWPTKPVQIIVPAPGGQGTADTIARIIAEELSKRLKSPFVIDNRAGANGNVGAAAAATAVPDGYRLLYSWQGTLAVNPAMYSNLPFDPQKSFAPIVLIADVPNILVVNNEFPAKNLSEFIRHVKANPDKFHFGTTGNGSSMHLAAELFMRETGGRIVHVPYNAPGQATTNMLSNDIQMMFQLIPGIIGQIKGGKVRPLAILSPTRSPVLPDVPTTAELGYPKLLSSTWLGLLAPQGTPAPILDKLNAEVNEILKDPNVKKRLADIGASPLGGTRKQFADHLAAETDKWGRIVRDAKIQIQ